MTTLRAEHAAALLKHRCELVAFEDDHDEAALVAGEPAACLPVLRHMFVHFSEALDDFFCDEVGFTFAANVTDEQLVTGILHVWPALSPDNSLGAISVAKVMQPGAFGMDRLLFTLQCVAVCARKHRALVAQYEDEWMESGFSWTDSMPKEQFGPEHGEVVGTDSQRERSTYAWMAEAYREQMDSLKLPPELPPEEPPVSNVAGGTLMQDKWIERLRCGPAAPLVAVDGGVEPLEISQDDAPCSSHGVNPQDEVAEPPRSPSNESSATSSSYVSACSSSTRDSNPICASLRLTGGGPPKFHEDEPMPTSDKALLTSAAHAAMASQLAHAGVGHLADLDASDTEPANGDEGGGGRAGMKRAGSMGSRARSAFARHYQEMMRSLRFSSGSRRSSGTEGDSFDDAIFENSFISDATDDLRSAANTQPVPGGITIDMDDNSA